MGEGSDDIAGAARDFAEVGSGTMTASTATVLDWEACSLVSLLGLASGDASTGSLEMRDACARSRCIALAGVQFKVAERIQVTALN